MKKIATFMAALVLMLLVFIGNAKTVSAAGDTITAATNISTGVTYSGSITDASPVDYYKFTLDAAGRINIRLDAAIQETSYYLYDANGDQVWSSTWMEWSDLTGMMSMNENIDLTKGTYYFSVKEIYGTGNYNFKISFTSAKETIAEGLNGSNQILGDADKISLGKKYNGQIAENDDTDIYKFTLTSAGRINIRLDATIERTDYYLYDANGAQIWSSTWMEWSDLTGMMSMDENIDLTKGTYYFAVYDRGGTGNYNFKISFTSANESFEETMNGSNQILGDADKISLGTKYNGQIALNDSDDIYKFTLTASGKINIRLDATIERTDYYLYDANGTQIWSSTWNTWSDSTGMMSLNEGINLTKGTYYFNVNYSSGTGNYNFKISFTSAKETIAEGLNGSNQVLGDADKISIDKTYKGQLALNDGIDCYKFTLKKAVSVNIKATSYLERIGYHLYNADGNQIWSKYLYKNDEAQKITLNETLELSAGTYYFTATDSYKTGNYNFSINHVHYSKSTKVTKATLSKNGKIDSLCGYCGDVVFTKTVYAPKTFKLSTTSYTYNGKVKTPSVTVKDSKGNTLVKGRDYTVTYAKGRKSLGTYKVTIKMKGDYSGTKTLTFKIKLATPKVKAANTSNGVKITWNKISGAKTYTVYRSVYSNGKWSGWKAIKTKVTGTSYTDKSVKSGATVRYTVRAINGSNASAYKASKTVKFLAQPTVKVAKATNGIKATWNKIAGAKSYTIYRRTFKNGKWSGWTKVKVTTSTSFIDKTAKKGVIYQYTVRAYSGGYNSTYKNSSSIKR